MRVMRDQRQRSVIRPASASHRARPDSAPARLRLMDTTEKTKGTHGGARAGAGRPRNPNKLTNKTPQKTLGQPLIVAPSQRAAGNAGPSSTSRPPAAFFLPHNTNNPAPLGNSAVTPMQTSSRNSFWSAGGLPRSTAAAVGNLSNTGPNNLQASGENPHTKTEISVNQFAQLNQELDFIDKNDEHADIAAGDRVFDESLVSEVLDNPEAGTATPEAETQSSTGYARRLKSMGSRYVMYGVISTTDRRTRCSHLKKVQQAPGSIQTFYTGGKSLYGCPTCFLAVQKGLYVSVEGLHLETDSTMIQLRVESVPCPPIFFSSPTASFATLDALIQDATQITKLPRFVQAAFPAYISARGAVSKLMMWQMSNTFATRFGPAPFSELVSEIQHRFHMGGELMYFGAANFYGQSTVKRFSAFNDREGYARSPPSVPYLKGLFTDYIKAHRIYIERDVATKPLTVGKGDHTFDFLKHMGGVKGERIFTAAYTVVNEYEEVRAHSLTSTKSLEFVEDMFTGIQQGLKDSNNPPTQIFYTDSPQSERSFHESIKRSLTENVVPVTDWTDLPSFERSPGVPTTFISDPILIEDNASDVVEEATLYTSSSQLYLIALAIKTEQRPGKPPRLDTSNVLPSLLAILTNPAIIKIVHSIRQTLQTISEAFFIPELEKISKAKWFWRFSTPLLPSYPWSGTLSALQNEFLFSEIDCIWQIYLALCCRDSLGLPLQPMQAINHNQLVTLVHGCKPVAEGSIIGHHEGFLDAFMDDQGHTKKINISASRSLIRITKSKTDLLKVLVPGAIHSLHKQTIKWISDHGAKAVVTTSQLLTRSETTPFSAGSSRAFAVPAPPTPTIDEEDFSLTHSTFSNSDIQFEHWLEESLNDGSDDEDDDSSTDSEPENDTYGHLAFKVQPSPSAMEGIESFGTNLDENSSAAALMEGIDQSFALVNGLLQSETFPTRILDDAFHYMDRLLRLLSKKHSAFKAFAHDFSEAIFIRDKSDVLAVRAVLEKSGVGWDGFITSFLCNLRHTTRRLSCGLPSVTTLAGGSNFTARKPLLDILSAEDNYVDVLPAIPLPNPAPDGELDLSIAAPNNPKSFDRMAEPVQAGHGDSEFQDWEHPDNTTTFRNLTEVLSAQPPAPPFPFTFLSPAPIQFPAETTPPIHRAQYQTFLPGCFAPTRRHAKPSPRRCALCVKEECDRRPDCPGKGGAEAMLLRTSSLEAGRTGPDSALMKNISSRTFGARHGFVPAKDVRQDCIHTQHLPCVRAREGDPPAVWGASISSGTGAGLPPTSTRLSDAAKKRPVLGDYVSFHVPHLPHHATRPPPTAQAQPRCASQESRG
ncbi:hypothetical protein B0H13DRAFT_2261376 [Mycena leptocephala]|nr:hypothetical protein B0H13DRAFT_2261376 [Mycena leptocephala]